MYTQDSLYSGQSLKSSTSRPDNAECLRIIRIQNLNPEAEQRHDNGRNIVMSSVLTKQEKLLLPFRKIFNKREYSFFFAFQIIEFLFSSAKECQCSQKSGSSSLELFMIYAYCHKGFEAWDSKN